MDVDKLLRQLDRGEVSFPEVVAIFEKTAWTPPKQPKDWGELYLLAEEGDPMDASKALYAAQFAGAISKAQRDQLLAIYSQKISQGPAG